MLAWITGKLAPPDNSLATEAGIDAFLESISMSKPAQALDEIGYRFASIAGAGPDSAACRRALLRLDDAAQAPQSELWQNVSSDGLGALILGSSWRALADFLRNVSCGYRNCLEQLPAPADLDDSELQDTLLMVNRAIAALASHNALARIRYREPNSAHWADIHALFARALQYGVAHCPVKLYPGMAHQTTAEREYVGALLFAVAPTGNLVPAQTHCLHLLLRHFNEHYHFADSYSPETPYYVDPIRNKPPQRWLVGLGPRPGLRFFGFGGARNALAVLREAARASTKRPQWVEQSRIDIAAYRALLDTLYEHWSDHPPQRRGRRERRIAGIIVTHGFASVHRVIARSKLSKRDKLVEYAKYSAHQPLNFIASRFGSVRDDVPPPDLLPEPSAGPRERRSGGDRGIIERWSVVDVSSGGVGALAENHRGWLRVGMLVGFRYHNSTDWQIATVRRLRCTPQSKLTVGLECQGELMGCALLRFEDALDTDVWLSAGIGRDPLADAILVGGERRTLVVAAGTYAPERVCVMKFGERRQTIRFDELVERGLDFERISYSQVLQDEKVRHHNGDAHDSGRYVYGAALPWSGCSTPPGAVAKPVSTP